MKSASLLHSLTLFDSSSSPPFNSPPLRLILNNNTLRPSLHIIVLIMKITSAAATALLLLASSASAFVTPSSRSIVTQLASSTISSPPERIAPDAGWVPEWEGRTGLSPEEFVKSDMSKPDLSGMWECPLTRWNSDGCVLICHLQFCHCHIFTL